MGQKPSEIRLHDWKRFSLLLIALAVLLVAGLLLNLNIGSVRIHPDRIVQMLFRGMEDSTESRILFSIRIPRMLLAAILGGALSVSGFLLQTFFRNPIAGPFVLGISSGAKLVVGITMIFFARQLAGASSVILILAAFAGSLIITTIVLLFSQRILSCVACDDVLRILKETGYAEKTMSRVTEKVAFHLQHRAEDMEMGTLLFSKEYGILGKTDNTEKLLQKIVEG